MFITRNIPNTRIDVADALRGIAVAGIILFHSVEHFDIFTQEPIVHTLPFDEQVGNVMAWLFSGKMYGVFAMLFGLSFFIMNDNQQQKHRNFSCRFAWRMCLLFLFGLVNVAFRLTTPDSLKSTSRQSAYMKLAHLWKTPSITCCMDLS